MNKDASKGSVTSRGTFWIILVSMLLAVVGLRLYLYVFGINHVYIAGHIVRHLFSGALLTIVAAFGLAFEPRRRGLAIGARAALGVGSALVLDEIVFLIATSASKEEYFSRASLLGSVLFIVLGAILLYVLYRLKNE